ncbi:MAG: 4-oxalocrotonate tautomerase family protein [Nitrospinota bacterium]
MPIVNIQMLPRTKEQKAQISKEITDTLVRVAKVAPERVLIIYNDIPSAEHFAKAGVLHSDQ